MLLRVATVQRGTFATARFLTLATERGKSIISSSTPHKIKFDPRTGGGTLTSERWERTVTKKWQAQLFPRHRRTALWKFSHDLLRLMQIGSDDSAITNAALDDRVAL